MLSLRNYIYLNVLLSLYMYIVCTRTYCRNRNNNEPTPYFNVPLNWLWFFNRPYILYLNDNPNIRVRKQATEMNTYTPSFWIVLKKSRDCPRRTNFFMLIHMYLFYTYDVIPSRI